ncbi:MAG: ATP-binding cassette domain-containing protein [Planctomycetes bacterium]|nr:ATP-binding cassette domain-containing protein [Planctomycetota bacterium]MCB9910321.1 ATP-binding cassette domain-containing protein [Planctomycetota bacterium]MCB9912068.1 ATP-binding cassette domain-containing protein [Planctomycetota bacterium]
MSAESIQAPQSDDDVVVRLTDVHKAFGSKQILRGVSFELLRGRCLGIMGGSGTGKSVTLRHIIGLMRPDQGKVEVMGRDLAEVTREELQEMRKRIGYVFQEGALINWLTVAENLALPLQENTKLSKSEIESKVQEKLALVHIPDAGAKFPSEISGGMKKRVGLARALITDPELILYDEPNAGLDPEISRSINHLMREVSETLNVTSLVVEHRIECIKTVADEVIFLYDGKVHVHAPVDEFFHSQDSVLKGFLGI